MKTVHFSMPEANIYSEWDEITINGFTYSFTNSLCIFTDIPIKNLNNTIIANIVQEIRKVIPEKIDHSKTWYHSGKRYDKVNSFKYDISIGTPFDGCLVFLINTNKKELEYLKNLIKDKK